MTHDNEKKQERRGRMPYGYRRVYDPYTRELLGVEIDPEQQQFIRRMRAERRRGASLAAITRMLLDAGVPPPHGALTWYRSSVRSILTNNEALYRHGTTIDGVVWPPLLDETDVDVVIDTAAPSE